MMKKYIKYMASLLAVSFAMSACIDLEEMNVDPNNATTTNPSLLLTGVAYSAFNQTSSDACHAAKMLILTSGESKYQVYKWTRGDFDYYSNLRDVTKMSEEAGEGSAYQALAHFFRANYFYQLTLDFGSIPYTDALKAETDANYQPAYDSQEVVLAGILKELEEAFFFFDGALVESGRRNPAWGTTTFTLIDLPDQEKPGEWAEKYKEKIIQAEKESLRFEKIRKQLTDARKMARRNRYTLEVYEQNNYLQNYSVRLILALRDYDLATHEQQREEAQMKLAEVCSSFSSMRTRLEEVYSKTRFMEQPAGYIEDMNHHNHLSAKSQNSDWLFLYELPMVEKVQKWLNSKTIK